MVKKENEAELRVLQATLADIKKQIIKTAEEMQYLRETEKSVIDSIDNLERE